MDGVEEVRHPHALQRGQVRRVGLDSRFDDVERTVSVHAEVIRRPDRDVGVGRADHRAQRDLDRRLHVDLGVHGELEHELAVLALTDLKERSLIRDVDVVALGIEHMRSGRSPVIWPPRMNVAVADSPSEAQCRWVTSRLSLPDVDRRFVERRHRGQAFVLARGREVRADAIEDLVGRGERARRLQHEHPVLARAEDVQLAVAADVVDPGVGPRVSEEDQSLVETEREAVGHVGALVALSMCTLCPTSRGELDRSLLQVVTAWCLVAAVGQSQSE